jgi:hypothetical protein
MELSSPIKLIKIDPEYKKIETLRKHRYLYILDKRSKHRILEGLKHPLLPYPKLGDGTNNKW